MANFFKKTAGSKVDAAKKQAGLALGLFAKASDKLQKANEKLAQTEEESLNEATELINEAERARIERQANELVQAKLKEFIPQV